MEGKQRTALDEFKDFNWSGFITVDQKNKKVMTQDGEVVLESDSKTTKLRFYVHNNDEKTLNQRSYYIEVLELDASLNLLDFVEFWQSGDHGGGYRISHQYTHFRKILRINENSIKKIKISQGYKGIRRREETLFVNSETFLKIKERAEEINSLGSSSKYSLETHLINVALLEFLNYKVKPVTTINQGDFDFNVQRLNLKTKKSKKDFLKYLDQGDTNALGALFEKMIKKDVFPEEYLRKIDDYFLKEKIRDIIELGREILDLKSEDIQTGKAKKLISRLDVGEIKQMETIWQKYFEKYLLYLVFSYKKIVPKIELKDIHDVDNKPDFVGVNHYNGIDIIEIKTHLKDVFVWDNSHKNFAFSSEMSKAIIQTINYMDSVSKDKFANPLDKKELMNGLDSHENLNHPRGIIIISSENYLYKGRKQVDQDRLLRDFTKLRNSVQNIEILTFSEILDIAERYSENVLSSSANTVDDDHDLVTLIRNTKSLADLAFC